MLNKILRKIEKFIPKKLFKMGQPIYHYSLALVGATLYRFPSKKIKIVAVTGTKGKTSTVEFVNTILEEAGKKTALAGTLRFKIGETSKPNLYKMTMPGRFFIQKFLRDAVSAGCEYAVLEISSEAAKQHRNKFIDLSALLFTNLAPEHIESHGSYEKYVDAKLSIARGLAKSSKKNKVLVVNSDDTEAEKFLAIDIEKKITYSMNDAQNISLTNDLTSFTYKGVKIESELLGKFNIYNMLAAIKYAESEGIDLQTIARGILKLKNIKGRAEKIDLNCDFPGKQDFKVFVDYAHTPDSLIAIYETFSESKIIGVLGNCGGGRDKWKRKAMAEIADKYCEEVILTDEDPYDDDPREIVDDMAQYFKKKPEIIMDRREAIASAMKRAKKGDVVIITGKGTDPYIMRKNGVKEKWSDAEVVREELRKILSK
jgi:UDP-N-acetylmuramoyl-L-alanyl-D-glutamate--2,6-diaminopimelate ligase